MPNNDVDFSKVFPVRATIRAGDTQIQTRYTLNIYETYVLLTFPDAKGLRLVLNEGELQKLIEAIQERKAISEHGGG